MATEGAEEPLAGRTVAGDWLADQLDRMATTDVPQRQQLEAALRQFAALDRAVYQAIASVPTPALDVAFRRLSHAADKSKLWLAIAAGLAIVGGPTGRRAAARGVLSIGATSALVNIGIKSLFRRTRPVYDGLRPHGLRRPRTSSFPSGHATSAFCAAALLSEDDPLWPLYYAVAGVVAWSRVYVKIHHASDVVAGIAIGAALGRIGRGLAPLPPVPSR